MKKLLKCVSVFVLAFALMPIVKADGPAEAITSGNLTLKSIPLTKEKDRMWYPNVQEEFSEWDDYDLDIDNDDINKGVLKKYNEAHEELATKNVTITYEYDEAIKKVVDGLIAKLGDDPIELELNDVEALTYRISADSYLDAHPEYSGEIDFPFFFSNFSLDLMKTIEYKNFNLLVGAGGGFYLKNLNMGELSFIYDDVFYGCGPTTTIQYNAVVFIPEGTADVPKAIKDRLSKYFDVKSVSDTYGDIGPLTAKDLAEIKDRQFYQKYKNDSNVAASQYATEDEYIASINYNNNALYGDYATKDSPVYFVEMADGAVAAVVAYEDSEKNADAREFKTSDVGTGIEVSVDGIIPLDTLISVARVTSGDEYDKIVSILKNNNVDMFDLKMITKANETITKLDDGKFRVKLPIKDEFKNKELKVYYVDEEDKVEEYKVTISDDGNYAIFETDHFSIYTLAAGEAIKNPKTGDNILLYVATLILSSSYLLTRKIRKN